MMTLRLRKRGEEPPPWYERPSLCFITGTATERCECCRCWTAGRTPLGSGAFGYLPDTPLCPGCDDMRRNAGLPVTEGSALHSQRYLHEAYDALPRAVRDYPLGVAHV